MLGKKMEQSGGKLILVTVSDDGMTAYLSLGFPLDDAGYTMEEVLAQLEANKVTFGIKKEEIQKLILEKGYGREIIAAQGVPPVDGKDGYFEFLFSTDVDTRPKILEDGSVDYSSLGEVAVVEQDSEIVKYHPAVKGANGADVRGKILIGKPGRELQPLKGKGFAISEDKCSYRASLTGKAEYQENSRRLFVSNLFIVNGDVNHVTGNIQFAGDIQIRGNVVSGTMVKAYGSITVDGCVEAAHLIAGKDVVLKNGMQGGGKGRITAGGNVSGKFFEQTSIEAKGNVGANAIMNCEIVCQERVLVSGKLGIIVGGSVNAIREVEATLIGNMSEMKTKVTVGVGSDLYSRLGTIQDEIQSIGMELKKLNAGMSKIDELMKQTGRKDLNEKKMQILRAKIEKDSNLSSLETQRQDIVNKMEKSSNSKIIVRKTIYPGVLLTINGVSDLLTTQNYNSTYIKKGAELTFIPNL